MDAFTPMLKNVLLFVLLAVPGYVLVKTKILKQEQSGVFSKILIYVGSPFFIITNTLNINFTTDTAIGILIVILCYTAFTFLYSFLSLGFSSVKGNFSLEQTQRIRGTIRYCEIFSNNGFLGLPLAAAVFSAGSNVFLYLIVCNILNNVFMYTLGTYLMSRDVKTISVKSLIANPVLISFIVAIALNFANVKSVIPEVATYSNYFNNIVTPISMTVLGMKMGGLKFSTLFKNKDLYRVSFCRLVLFPVVAVGLTFLAAELLPSEKANLINCMFIACAMPTAGLASAFADKYDGDSEGAVIYTLGTTILSVITIPILYMLLCLLI
jgi:predicted permease